MTEKRVKVVCVLGAGASGLPAIKICLEYGFQPVCFEKSNDIGGLWRYKNYECPDEASVMKSTVINTSKEMMAYSDFPPPPEFPNFMHNTKVQEYLRLYAERFSLLPHIRFETTVLQVRRSSDYESTGRWDIICRDKNGEEMTETVDAVLLCSGHHVKENVPAFPGLERFQGRVMHSHSYKDHRGFEDKIVVAVGVGNSGGDIAVELSRIAKQVYLVSRRGTWVFHRVGDFGHPLDALFNRRLFAFLIKNFPNAFGKITEFQLNYRFNHENFGLRPAHGVFQAHLTINDDLPNRIQCGSILVKPNVREFTEDGAVFEDGSRVDGVDCLILSTGYQFGFPYLEPGVIPVHENQVSLFKYMYPPDLTHPTLMVVGLIQPLGAIMPISEMQCRVFCDVLCGKSQLPKRAEMLEDVANKKEMMMRRYIASPRHTIQVDYIPYMEELADIIGVRPRLASFLSDPALFYQLFLGPCVPYHFRLQGPHPWPEARDAILTVWDRILYPTNPKKAASSSTKTDTTQLLLVCFVVLFIFFIILKILF